MWNLDQAKFIVTYSYSRVFAGNSGSDIDVAMEVVTSAPATQLSLGLVMVDSNGVAQTLERTEKNPVAAESPNGVSVVLAGRFMNVPSGTYKAVASDGVDGAPGLEITVP